LKVNLANSELIPVCDVDQVESLVDILGCGVAILPVNFLGLPLGVSYKSIHIWDGVIKKIERRLASWKKGYTFPSEVESPLSRVPLPTYPRIFCLFFLSWQVCMLALSSYNETLWGGIGDEFKYHLVS
jgi:hypothetical protein